MNKRVSLVGIRYARSLMKLAGENKDQYQIYFDAVDDLFSIKEARFVLKNPIMPTQLKMDLLVLAFDKGQANELFRNFVSYVLGKKRGDLLPDIARAYSKLVAQHKNEVSAQVMSAHPLPSTLQEKINESLQNLFKKKVLSDFQLDPKILGGFTVQVDHFLLDYSLRTKINRAMA